MQWDDTPGETLPPPATESGSALFVGDTGELPLETRRALAQLLAGPSLDGRRHSKLWPALLRDESAVRKRLSELFLELIIEPDLQIAFIRKANLGDLEAPTLLRAVNLTFLDSVLLLHLRQLLTQATAQDERAVVGLDQILEHLSVYERAVSTDRAGFTKRCQSAIEKFKKSSILHKIRSSDDRFEISPTLKILFPAEEVLALTQLYDRMSKEGAAFPTLAAELEEEPEQ